MTGESFNWDGSGAGSEDTVPERERWWAESVDRYANEKEREGEWNELTVEERAADLKAWPLRFEMAGFPRPRHIREVTPTMVVRWKATPVGPGGKAHKAGRMDDSSADALLICLRGYRRWAERTFRLPKRERFAEKKAVWKHRRGPAKNRRYLAEPEIDRLFAASPDRLKPMVALMAWVGLRRREAWSLTCGNVELAVDARSVKIVRKGGDPDKPPIPVTVLNALRPAVLGRRPEERVYPFSIGLMEKELRRVGMASLGKPVSPHDLRRSFGRNLYYVHHVDIAVIAALYHHRTTGMALYYIGASEDLKREAVSAFDKPRPTPPPDARNSGSVTYDRRAGV